MHLTRTIPALALAGVLALAGCAADQGSAAESDGAQAEETAPAERTVTTDYGDVEVPTDPQRVVVLNYALAGYLYDLDVPVTATIPEDADATEGEYSEFWADEAQAAGTEFLPWSVDGFDLEAVLAADPDLIIGGGIGFPLFQAEAVYDELSDIAPTVLVSGSLSTWQQQFAFLAEDVFDAPEVYADAVTAYEERAAEVADAITPPEGPVAQLVFTGDGTPYGLVEDLGLPTQFADVGIEVDTVFADNDFEVYGGGGDMFELSTEQVGQVYTQPTLFVLGFNGDVIDIATLEENPVYAALPAFESDSVHLLPHWTLRGDYDEALATLDILEDLFA
ncbi:ABC transporter substrate-binding protein [Microbacterium karelineae]|uniref:ABC transporter substrate-binding protein n=1 Tax=Microbacterium karelineae TaxID=2654283 RepID=UPI0012EA3557|nr:ABC transporter substrate-binding protein [Microbacterium karelineae]